jgi:hypothetical protein
VPDGAHDGPAEAEKSGLVARVYPADQLLDETLKAAAVIAGFSLPVVMMVKEAVNRAFESSLNEGLERRAFHASFGLEDQKEGMAAFVEKAQGELQEPMTLAAVEGERRDEERAMSTGRGGPVLLVATRKGAWIYHGDAARRSWRVDGPHFLGHIVNHLVLDPRDGRTLLAAAKTGHLGPTLFRSSDLGRSWQEARRPPAFGPAVNGLAARAVDHTFWLTPAHAGEPGVWYAGTSPQGLFRSEDGGDTWAPFSCINDDPQYRQWFGTVQDGTPDGPKLHSLIVDPRDPRHLYFAMSGGGVHESTRRRRDLCAAGRGHGNGRRIRPRRRDLPRPALPPSLFEQPGPPLPAEPLRHLPAGPSRPALGAHRPADAGRGR